MSESIYPINTRAEAKAQGLKYYFTGKPCVHGHLSEKLTSNSCCVECRRSDAFKLHQKEYAKSDRGKEYQKTSNKNKEYHRKYAQTDKSKIGRIEYRNSPRGKESNKKCVRKHQQLNKKHILEQQREYVKNRRAIDPLYKLTENIRSLIRISIKNRGFKKSSKTANILGCSFEEFKIHIENQFTEGMTWENHGEWHYDHIYPVGKRRDEAHLIELNHYTNFQPLWADDNWTKGSKIL